MEAGKDRKDGEVPFGLQKNGNAVTKKMGCACKIPSKMEIAD